MGTRPISVDRLVLGAPACVWLGVWLIAGSASFFLLACCANRFGRGNAVKSGILRCLVVSVYECHYVCFCGLFV